MLRKLSGLSVSIILFSSLLLSGCQSKAPSDTPKGTEETTAASTEALMETTTGTEAGTSEGTSTPEDTALVNIVSHSLEIKGKVDIPLAVTGKFPEIKLSDDYKRAHSSLSEALDKYNSESDRSVRSDVSELGLQADEWLSMEDGPGSAIFPLSSECETQLMRLDDQVMVVEDSSFLWGGGAHPSSGWTYHVWDVNTGEKLGIRTFMNHESGLAAAIYDELKKDYPEVNEIIESDPTSYIEGLIKKNELNCAPYGNVLHVHFDQYEIASYAAGAFDITLSPEEYGVFLNKSILSDKTGDLKSLVAYSEEEAEEVSAGEDRSMFTPDCPSWKYYARESLKPSDSHVTLTETFKESTDWLNTDSWESRHNFKKPTLPYSDGEWIYEPTSYRDYWYMYDALDITNIKSEKTISFNLDTLLSGPDEENADISKLTQYLRYAVCRDDILYLSIGHNTYAESEPRSSYIAAIDIHDGGVIWKTEPLVSNALNFIVTDNTIICGYGFTDEDDFIYELDRNTGEKVNTIPVKTGPDEFQVRDGKLYVATYNTEYEYDMKGE